MSKIWIGIISVVLGVAAHWGLGFVMEQVKGDFEAMHCRPSGSYGSVCVVASRDCWFVGGVEVVCKERLDTSRRAGEGVR